MDTVHLEGSRGKTGATPGRPELDLVTSGRLPPIPAALVDGDARDLLAPLQFLPPGALPRDEPPPCDRTALAQALAEANASYGHPRARELGRRLADPATRVIATGQQPGLYGGPLLTLTKMAAAVRWAEALEKDGQPAVAVFWVATEDHDFSESTKIALLARDGARSYDLGPDPSQLQPVGERTFGAALGELEERLAEEIGDTLTASALPFARRFYHPEARFGEAFTGFYTALLGERAPLFLDSRLPVVKRLQSPWLRRLVERRHEIDEELERAHAELKRRGLPQQVRHQKGRSPLFLVTDGQRRRIVWEGDDRFRLRGGDADAAPVEELLRIADLEPERISPGVLCRPAVQDALLGTTLQVMGPAEMSYLPQASAVYRVVEAPAPWTTLRPQILELSERQLGQLTDLGVSFAELIEQDLDELVALKLHEDFVAPVRAEMESLFDSLREPVLAIEAQLEKPWQKTRDQIGRAFDQLNGKITGAVARRHDVWRRRLERIREHCLPDKHLQERHLTTIHYLARYGPSFVDAFWSQMDLDPRRLQVLTMNRGDES